MAKFWQPGEVKTRLANSLNSARTATLRDITSDSGKPVLGGFTDPMAVSAEIHRRFVCHLLTRLAGVGEIRQLVGSPVDRLADFQAALVEQSIQGWQVTDQGTGDLGRRMKRWFEHLLFRPVDDSDSEDSGVSQNHTLPVADRQDRAMSCVLIGADCPLLSQDEMDQAWKSLETHDLVLGPADDGGYYLIGLRGSADLEKSRTSGVTQESLAGLFEGIAWSTPDVFEQTLAAAERSSLSVGILPTRHDVDTAEDLVRLAGTIAREFPEESVLLDGLFD
ncbi:TIGR04282 family arsenosugar biosynthesis glycosyltransferase [Rhodopirellula sallentina]|nr:TIGR04282 family arsenosugar biosynthesis glycosyltransferase [Rhodopirellula sallentina]